MRIAHYIPALIAVLGLAAVVQVSCHDHFNDTLHEFPHRSFSRKRHENSRLLGEGSSTKPTVYYNGNISLNSPGMYRGPRENQALLRLESQIQNRKGADCCPTVQEMVEPDGGKNQDGIYVKLYRDENYKQRFYELSCHRDILNKPCRFMDKKLHSQSKCVQQFSYSYALVLDTPERRNRNLPMFPTYGSGGATYTLDYIMVRSGCSCVVTPAKRKRKGTRHKRLDDER